MSISLKKPAKTGFMNGPGSGAWRISYACGTGTGASVYALAEKRRCGDHAEVEVKGGLLIVDIVRDGKKCRDLLLTGPASMVCTGEIFDEAISQ